MNHRERVLGALERFYDSQRKRADDRAPGRRSRLARAIASEVPQSSTGAIPADQLALVLVLEERGALTVGEIVEALGRSQASTSDLVDRAQLAGRVQRFRRDDDQRVHLVGLTPKAIRERERTPTKRQAAASSGGTAE